MDTSCLIVIVIGVIGLINLIVFISYKVGQNTTPLSISPENRLVLQYSFLLSFWAGVTGGAMFYFFDKMSFESVLIFGIACLVNLFFFILIGYTGKKKN